MEITHIETNHVMGKISRRVTSECDGLDFRAVPIKKLLCNGLYIPRRSSQMLQRFKTDGAEYLRDAVSQREVDGMPYSIGDSN